MVDVLREEEGPHQHPHALGSIADPHQGEAHLEDVPQPLVTEAVAQDPLQVLAAPCHEWVQALPQLLVGSIAYHRVLLHGVPRPRQDLRDGVVGQDPPDVGDVLAVYARLHVVVEPVDCDRHEVHPAVSVHQRFGDCPGFSLSTST